MGLPWRGREIRVTCIVSILPSTLLQPKDLLRRKRSLIFHQTAGGERDAAPAGWKTATYYITSSHPGCMCRHVLKRGGNPCTLRAVDWWSGQPGHTWYCFWSVPELRCRLTVTTLCRPCGEPFREDRVWALCAVFLLHWRPMEQPYGETDPWIFPRAKPLESLLSLCSGTLTVLQSAAAIKPFLPLKLPRQQLIICSDIWRLPASHPWEKPSH